MISKVNGIAQRLGFIIVDAVVIAVTWRAMREHVLAAKAAKIGITTSSTFLREGQWLSRLAIYFNRSAV